MKYELEKEEMQAIYNGLNTMISSMLQVFMLSIKNEHEINLKRLDFEHRRLVLEEEERRLANDQRKIEYLQTHADYIEPMDDYKVPDEIDASVYGPKPLKYKGKIMENGLFPEPTLNTHQKVGKVELQRMLALWLQNFQKEDAIQPDRGEFMEELSRDGSRAGAIISYCMQVGGLTKAIWNVISHMEIEQDKTPEFIRYVAGNITQVASCYLELLSDQFEYPNPLLSLEQ